MKKNRVGGIAAAQLKSIVSRIEKLEEEKSGISADIRDVFAEAKGNGFDIKAIRTIITESRKEKDTPGGRGSCRAGAKKARQEPRPPDGDITSAGVSKMRKIDASEREEQEMVPDTYLHALGMTG